MNFLLVDGSYYVFYRYYAMHQWWKNAHKDKVNEISIEDISKTEIFVNAFKKAFVSKFREISKKLKLGKHVVMVGKDCHRKDIWRMKYYPSYKAQREYEDHFEGAQFFKLAYDELYAAAGATTILEYPSLEADDCIAITVKHILNSYEDANIYVITSDTDYLLHKILEHWLSEEKRLGIEIDVKPEIVNEENVVPVAEELKTKIKPEVQTEPKVESSEEKK